MNLKTKIFNSYKKDEIRPIMFLGVWMDFDELCFIMDELEEKYKNEIVMDEKDYIFYKLVEKFGCNENLAILLGDESGFIANDEVYVGVPLRAFPEAYSITRMKCEVYEDLVKLNLLNHNDDLDSIHIFNDIFIKPQEKKEEVKENGSV